MLHDIADRRLPATLLHVSDCHLGSGRADVREEAAFECAIDFGTSSDIDAVLITGDLFDNGRVGEDLLQWTAEHLDRLGKPVILLPGNHDLYALPRFDPVNRCRNVHLISNFEGEVVDVADIPISVWGRAMAEHEPAFRPLAGVPARWANRWCVVAGHGLVIDGRDPYRSSPIGLEDLADIDWDYIALGHVHEHQHVAGARVPAFYAGATAASRKGISGAVKVDFVPGSGAAPTWVDLSR